MREETSARFAIHELDAPAVQSGNADLTCAGWLYNEPFHPFPVDQLLQGGEHFQLGRFELDILHLPGHAPGCIGVKVYYGLTGQTILIPGDAVQGAFGKRIRSNVATWKRSLRRLMMEHFDFMVTNHLPAGSQTPYGPTCPTAWPASTACSKPTSTPSWSTNGRDDEWRVASGSGEW